VLLVNCKADDVDSKLLALFNEFMWYAIYDKISKLLIGIKCIQHPIYIYPVSNLYTVFTLQLSLNFNDFNVCPT